jgi:hypothetical protein
MNNCPFGRTAIAIAVFTGAPPRFHPAAMVCAPLTLCVEPVPLKLHVASYTGIFESARGAVPVIVHV